MLRRSREHSRPHDGTVYPPPSLRDCMLFLMAPALGCMPSQHTRADNSQITPHHTTDPTIHYEGCVLELRKATEAKARQAQCGHGYNRAGPLQWTRRTEIKKQKYSEKT